MTLKDQTATTTMNDAQYKAFVESVYDGRLVVGVDRVFARKLYTDVATSVIEEATGEAPYIEKLVIWLAFLASPLAMLSCAVLTACAFHWWAILIVPLALVWWIFNKLLSVRGGSSIWWLTLVLIAAVTVHTIDILPTPWLSGSLAVFSFALWADRLLYCAATFFLRAFVLRNQRALVVFGDGITLREAHGSVGL